MMNSEKQSKNNHKRSLSSDTFLHMMKSKAGTLSILIIVFGSAVNFFIVYTNQLPPSWFNTFPDVEHKNYYFGFYLAKTWAHLSTFVIGLLAGHLCGSVLQIRSMISSQTGSIDRNSISLEETSSGDRAGGSQESPASARNPLKTSESTSTLSTTATISADESPASNRNLVITVDSSTANTETKSQVGKSSPRVGGGGASGCLMGSYRFIVQSSMLTCMLAILFATYQWSTQELPSPLVSATYDSLSRLAWCLILVILMVQLCLPNTQTGKPSRMGRIFGCRLFVPMGRLSLLAYLWTPYVHSFILAVQEQSLFPSLFMIFHVTVGNIVIIYIVSFIVSILIERPISLALSEFINSSN